MAPTFAYRDGRFFRDGAPLFVVAAELQYYRAPRDRWAGYLAQLKAAHCNVVTCYVPWRHHLVSGLDAAQRFDFTGETLDRRDLAGFLRMAALAGLYVIAKPGPFVHSELNIGGLPDVASPSFNKSLMPVRKHDGTPLRWGYDDALLPSTEDERYESLARTWLEACGAALRPFAAPDGPLIGIQLNDETLYCTSNAPPWDYGYETQAGPSRPTPERPIATEKEAAALVRWGDRQWRLRRDAYARYKAWLGLEALPHLTNFAGITPPIEENIPGKEGTAEIAPARDDFARLYADWWFAMNRIEADLDVCEYGMISWLGVAAYGIPNPRETDLDRGDANNAVFARYINTARRRRGINMEENWGFATLYHPWSRHPVAPFFQTLACVAGGCTGYVVFTGVSHDTWTDDLDRVTRRQHPWFPSDAPIRPDGTTTPLYDAMRLLGAWFAREGESYLRAECAADVTGLVYAPHAAVSGWVPDARYWRLPRPIPRSGADALEPLAFALQRLGYMVDLVDLQATPLEELLRRRVCVLPSREGLDEETAAKLRAFEAGGGVLLPCDARAPDTLRGLGVTPRLATTPGLRAFLYESATDRYVWFFGFDRGAGPHEHRVAIRGGPEVRLRLGAKSCGVVHLRGERIVSVLVKGRNEVEGTETDVSVACGADEVRGRGDFVTSG